MSTACFMKKGLQRPAWGSVHGAHVEAHERLSWAPAILDMTMSVTARPMRHHRALSPNTRVSRKGTMSPSELVSGGGGKGLGAAVQLCWGGSVSSSLRGLSTSKW